MLFGFFWEFLDVIKYFLWEVKVNKLNFYIFFVKVNDFLGNCFYINKMMYIKLNKLGYNLKVFWYKI